MAINRFESSRISEGTLMPGAQHIGTAASEGLNESSSVSRNDVRDGGAIERPSRVVSAGSLVGDRVVNPAGEDLGIIEEVMVDIPTGRVAYAVLSFGGFLGIGNKLFAIPWSALRLEKDKHEFVLDVDRERIERAPGFDKDQWPDMADRAFADMIHIHYGKVAQDPQ